MIVGYARVSSREQHLHVQLDKLSAAGCERVYQEKQSGMSDQRPQLQACLDFVRAQDILVVTKLDRLARNMAHLLALDTRLKALGVELRVLDQQIDTTTPQGKLLFGMLAVFAEFENDLRKERQLEGIRKAQALGKHFGRGKALTLAQVGELHQLRASGAQVAELRKRYGLTRTSIYRYLAQAQPAAAEAAD